MPYHGPGQRVAYVMLDLTKHGNDIRAYVHNLESWVISPSPTLVLPESVARAASVSGYRTALARENCRGRRAGPALGHFTASPSMLHRT